MRELEIIVALVIALTWVKSGAEVDWLRMAAGAVIFTAIVRTVSR
jgi:hypothetical protein